MKERATFFILAKEILTEGTKKVHRTKEKKYQEKIKNNNEKGGKKFEIFFFFFCFKYM